MCYFAIPSLLIVQHCSLALLASERERLGGFSLNNKTWLKMTGTELNINLITIRLWNVCVILCTTAQTQ